MILCVQLNEPPTVLDTHIKRSHDEVSQWIPPGQHAVLVVPRAWVGDSLLGVVGCLSVVEV